jgi:hypothetical protein
MLFFRAVTVALRAAVLAPLLLPAAVRADDTCASASQKALDATTVATGTLANATRYMTSHDDWCEGGNVGALEQQDGEAVDRAWSQAINAQNLCAGDAKFYSQMSKLILALHNRRLKIDNQLASLRAKCD